MCTIVDRKEIQTSVSNIWEACFYLWDWSWVLVAPLKMQKPQTTADQKIRIGYQKNGPLLILKNLGTLENRLEPLGYKVEWHEFQAGPALLEALTAGSIDFGRTGDSPPIFAQASGSSLQYIAVGYLKVQRFRDFGEG